ncbi:MAG: Asp-tRNA(Asn)/Glu-tRNA(Gln) amidotransferase subunit GatA [Rickettsiales bacterium]
MNEQDFFSVKKLSGALARREVSAAEATGFFLKRIERDKALNAFHCVTEDIAFARAAEADARLQAGAPLHALDGVPVAVKDLFCTEGATSESCSNILRGFIPPYESTVTQQLRDAGAVMLGKVNMDEFAMGSSTASSCYGKTANPWKNKDNPDDVLTPGGSSGGSATAVAAGLAPFSLGSDTGGSIRQPAAFCGIVGLKPTYGRCSRRGMIAFASSLDQAGVFTNNVEDAAITLQAICGYDAWDATSSQRDVGDFASELGRGVKGKRIGVPKEYDLPGLPDSIKKLWEKSVTYYKDAGAEIIDVSLPHTEYALATYYVVAPAEASSNLARYDGVRYGKRADGDFPSLDAMYARTRSEGFGDEVKRRIMIGTYVLSSGYYDAYYVKAQKVRARIAEDFSRAFEKVDAILAPVTPTPAFSLETKPDPLTMYMNDVFTIPASLAGLPAMSVPTGYADNGLPLGMQLIAPHFAEASMLGLAAHLEEAAGFKGYL